MPGTKRVINIGTNPDDGTGDLLRDALNKVNLNFDDVWEYTSVNSNLNITGDSINGTTDVIINPADTAVPNVPEESRTATIAIFCLIPNFMKTFEI